MHAYQVKLYKIRSFTQCTRQHDPTRALLSPPFPVTADVSSPTRWPSHASFCGSEQRAQAINATFLHTQPRSAQHSFRVTYILYGVYTRYSWSKATSDRSRVWLLWLSSALCPGLRPGEEVGEHHGRWQCSGAHQLHYQLMRMHWMLCGVLAASCAAMGASLLCVKEVGAARA